MPRSSYEVNYRNMKTLAKALIQSALFFECSGEDVIKLDESVRAAEDIAHTLQSASPEELAAVREALQELAAEERAGIARADVLSFYERFFESIGVTAPVPWPQSLTLVRSGRRDTQ